MKNAWMCEGCSRLRLPESLTIDSVAFCEAFPNGIRAEVGKGADHRKPIEGDHGIRFEPADEGAARWVVKVWGK